MDQSLFDELDQTLTANGPAAAIDQLCTRLRQRKDYSSLFYALLMKKRHELGVSPVPTGPSQDLPASVHEPYENAIRDAARLVGRLYLDEGNIPAAWMYYRMLDEAEPVARALETHQPEEDEDVQQLVQIAFYEGLQPRRGFDLILERFGICSAITTLGSQELPHPPEVREYCIRRLVHALYRELAERLRAEILRHDGTAPPEGTPVRDLIAGRDWLFEDDWAHVDLSHLCSVVQMSIHLPPGKDMDMVREMCAYGRRLPERLRYPGDPPFEDQFRDYDVYLAALCGDDVEGAVRHFERKAEQADPETVGTYPAEVLVNLLLRLDRPKDALAAARRFLANTDSRRLSCPGIAELCQRAGDYGMLADVAREQGDPVHFVAGRLAAAKG
jgi:hypothetical protein